VPAVLYLDQNYLSGMAKRKPAFRELEPVLRDAVRRAVVEIPESQAHRLESAPRPDLGLLELLRDLSGGRTLPDEPDLPGRRCARTLHRLLARDYPDRAARASDEVDVAAMALALPACDLVTCDAFMAELVRRARLDARHGCELFTGRRPDVLRLRERILSLG
jgi:hypothetical protein